MKFVIRLALASILILVGSGAQAGKAVSKFPSPFPSGDEFKWAETYLLEYPKFYSTVSAQSQFSITRTNAALILELMRREIVSLESGPACNIASYHPDLSARFQTCSDEIAKKMTRLRNVIDLYDSKRNLFENDKELLRLAESYANAVVSFMNHLRKKQVQAHEAQQLWVTSKIKKAAKSDCHNLEERMLTTAKKFDVQFRHAVQANDVYGARVRLLNLEALELGYSSTVPSCGSSEWGDLFGERDASKMVVRPEFSEVAESMKAAFARIDKNIMMKALCLSLAVKSGSSKADLDCQNLKPTSEQEFSLHKALLDAGVGK